MDDIRSSSAVAFGIENTTGDAHVRVLIHGRELPTATDFNDANWLRTTIYVRLGAMMGGSFAAEVTATLRTDEIESFRAELSELVDGRRTVARFESMEEWLELEVDPDDGAWWPLRWALRHGVRSWHVTGKVCDQPALGSTLRFQIGEVERHQLDNLRRQLAEVLEAYPVVGSPRFE